MRNDSIHRIRRGWSTAGAFMLLAGLLRVSPAFAQAPGTPTGVPSDSTSASTPEAPPAAPSNSTPTSAPRDSAAAAATMESPNQRLVVGSRRVRLIGKSDNVVRSGPGNGFSIAGVYPRGRIFTVIATSGEWVNVRLSDSETGWIHTSLCREMGDLSGLEFTPNPKLYTRTGSYVLGAYAGAYAFDRKSNSLVLGGRVGYYVFDRFQAEAGVAWTHVRRAQEIVESLFDLSLESENFQMLFYQMNLTWELLPGRQMIPFVSGGVGSTIMLGRAETSINFGAGTRMFFSKRTAMRWEVHDYRFTSGSDSARLSNNNIEFTLGTEHLF